MILKFENLGKQNTLVILKFEIFIVLKFIFRKSNQTIHDSFPRYVQ